MSGELAGEGWFDIVSLNVSQRTGTRKRPVPTIELEAGRGVAGDAHEGLIENRQVSLLAVEDIEAASATLCGAYGEREERATEGGGPEQTAARGATAPAAPRAARLTELKPGDFAENITTRGVRLHELPLGTRIELGTALLELSKIGKECHSACEIRALVGDCVMPRRGVFARVIKGGTVSNADRGHYRFG